jgi:hypothetical protein
MRHTHRKNQRQSRALAHWAFETHPNCHTPKGQWLKRPISQRYSGHKTSTHKPKHAFPIISMHFQESKARFWTSHNLTIHSWTPQEPFSECWNAPHTTATLANPTTNSWMPRQLACPAPFLRKWMTVGTNWGSMLETHDTPLRKWFLMMLVVAEGSMNSCRWNKFLIWFYHFLTRVLQRLVILKKCARRLLYRIVPQECCAGVVNRNPPNNRNCCNRAIYHSSRTISNDCLLKSALLRNCTVCRITI